MRTDKQSVNYFYIARGSSAEVLTQAIISFEINYTNADSRKPIFNRCRRSCAECRMPI